eukprot:2386717-Rhodomonas_salina.2
MAHDQFRKCRCRKEQCCPPAVGVLVNTRPEIRFWSARWSKCPQVEASMTCMHYTTTQSMHLTMAAMSCPAKPPLLSLSPFALFDLYGSRFVPATQKCIKTWYRKSSF